MFFFNLPIPDSTANSLILSLSTNSTTRLLIIGIRAIRILGNFCFHTMNPLDAKLILEALDKLFAEQDARWDRRFADLDAAWDRRSATPSSARAMGKERDATIALGVGTLKQYGAAQAVTADNWGGFFENHDAAECIHTNAQPSAASCDVSVVVDNWSGLFEEPTRIVEERVPIISALNTNQIRADIRRLSGSISDFLADNATHQPPIPAPASQLHGVADPPPEPGQMGTEVLQPRRLNRVLNFGSGAVPEEALHLSYVDDSRDWEAVSLVCRRRYGIDTLWRKYASVSFCYAVDPARLLGRFSWLESCPVPSPADPSLIPTTCVTLISKPDFSIFELASTIMPTTERPAPFTNSLPTKCSMQVHNSTSCSSMLLSLPIAPGSSLLTPMAALMAVAPLPASMTASTTGVNFSSNIINPQGMAESRPLPVALVDVIGPVKPPLVSILLVPIKLVSASLDTGWVLDKVSHNQLWPPPVQCKIQCDVVHMGVCVPAVRQLRPCPWPSFHYTTSVQFEIHSNGAHLRPTPWPSFKYHQTGLIICEAYHFRNVPATQASMIVNIAMSLIQQTPPWPPPKTRRNWVQLIESFILCCPLCQSAVPSFCCASCPEYWKVWLELLQNVVQVHELNGIYVAIVSVIVVGTEIQVELSSFMEELLQKLRNQHLGCILYPSIVKVDAITRMDSLLSEMQDDGVHAMHTPWPSFDFRTAAVQLKTFLPLVRFLVRGFSWLPVIRCSIRVTSATLESCTYMTMSRKLADVVGLLGFLSFGLVVVTTLAVDPRPIPWPLFGYSAVETDLMSALLFYFEPLVDYELLEAMILRDDFLHLSGFAHSDFHVSPCCNFYGLVQPIRLLHLLSQWTFHYLLFLLNGSDEAASVLPIGTARWRDTDLLLLHDRKIAAVTPISMKVLLDCTLPTVFVLDCITLQPWPPPELLDTIINSKLSKTCSVASKLNALDRVVVAQVSLEIMCDEAQFLPTLWLSFCARYCPVAASCFSGDAMTRPYLWLQTAERHGVVLWKMHLPRSSYELLQNHVQLVMISLLSHVSCAIYVTIGIKCSQRTHVVQSFHGDNQTSRVYVQMTIDNSAIPWDPGGLASATKPTCCCSWTEDCHQCLYIRTLLIPWDPGGSELLHRLGGKPKLKPGGMLGILYMGVSRLVGYGLLPNWAHLDWKYKKDRIAQGKTSINYSEPNRLLTLRLQMRFIASFRGTSSVEPLCLCPKNQTLGSF